MTIFNSLLIPSRWIMLRFALSFKNISTHAAQQELMLTHLWSRYATEGKHSCKSIKYASTAADLGLAGKIWKKRSLNVVQMGFGCLQIISMTDIFPAFSSAMNERWGLVPAVTISGARTKWPENSHMKYLWKFCASSYTSFRGMTTLWSLVWCWDVLGFRRAKFCLGTEGTGIQHKWTLAYVSEAIYFLLIFFGYTLRKATKFTIFYSFRI